MTAPDRPLPNTRSTSESPAVRSKGSGGRIPNGLLALGSAAVMTIYLAGYLRTKSAADRFANADGARRRPAPSAGPTAPESAGLGGGLAVSGLAVSGIADSALPKPVSSSAAANSVAPPVATVVAPSVAKKSSASPAADNAHATDAATAVASMATESAPASTDSIKSAAAVAPVAAPAPTPPPAPAPVVAPGVAPKLQLHDGTYTGYGTSRHGDIEATVVIEGGRIATAAISRCLTRYSCSWVAHLQQQVVTRQSPEVDYVSGATESTNAFYYAVVEALTKAK